LEEYFNNDKEGRAAAIIESLRFRTNNYVEQSGRSLPWKDPSLKTSYELLKGDLETIVSYIKQQLQKLSQPPVQD
jgi:hypothetical protein